MSNGFYDVASHLQSHAMASSNEDAFARSAFNRYYYAMFLAARDFFVSINIVVPNHKDVPNVFENSVKRVYRQAAGKGASHSRPVVSAERNADGIAALFRKHYKDRVVADYCLDIRVMPKGGEYLLDGRSISEMQTSFNALCSHLRSMRDSWTEINA